MSKNKKETKSKDQVVLERIQAEIDKIDKKENKIFFFVLDTKGNPSGSLEYIYRLAHILHEKEYNVTMLYQEEEEFVGVGEWMGEKYASLPHENIAKEETGVSPSDILFIPEIFANVMTQAKQLPCKKVALLQNYDFISEQLPLSIQWGDLNVMDALVNTVENETLLKEIFPYVKTKVVPPYIDDLYHDTNEPKKMIVNIVSKDPSMVNRVVKPFYWTYPLFKWVTFRDLRGFSNEEFASKLKEGAITIWIDEVAPFGYSALAAMKSGSLLLAKLANNRLPWATTETGEFINGCTWFDNVRQLPQMIAQLVRAWVTNNQIAEEIVEEGKKIANQYTKDKTEKELVEYIEMLLSNRKDELHNLLLSIKGQKQETPKDNN